MYEIYLRNASLSDSLDLYNCRIDPSTRINSHNQETFSFENHQNWLQKCLNDSLRQLYILEVNSIAVGTSRLDDHDQYQEISWSIYPEHRGNSYGATLIKETLQKATKLVIAEILENNKASIHIAEKAGLKFILRHQNKSIYYYFAQDFNNEDSILAQIQTLYNIENV